MKKNKRKVYRTPTVSSENLQVGVFGSYGGQTPPVQVLEPYFGLCCY